MMRRAMILVLGAFLAVGLNGCAVSGSFSGQLLGPMLGLALQLSFNGGAASAAPLGGSVVDSLPSAPQSASGPVAPATTPRVSAAPTSLAAIPLAAEPPPVTSGEILRRNPALAPVNPLD